MAYKIKEKTQWLSKQESSRLATTLVENFAEAKDLDELRKLINGYREGKPHKPTGKQVYVSTLLGKMKDICPEMVQDLMEESEPEQKEAWY